MACQVIAESRWSLGGLMGAFLNLGIAYFLLSCSTFAYFFAKFFSLFGLSLPTPCSFDYLFGNPNRDPCSLRVSVDYPTTLHLSVQTKSPSNKNDHINDCKLNSKELDEDDEGVGKRDVKGKKGIHVDVGLRKRRRRGATVDFDVEDPSPSSVPPRQQLSNVSDFESNEGTTNEANKLDNNNLKNNNVLLLVDGSSKDDDKNAVKILVQALEKEQADRAALWAELEQERAAAATALDETLAVILRLHQEKASIEIEARHYEMMLEQQLAYDAREINLLKEIIVRSERAKHLLHIKLEEAACYRRRKALQDNNNNNNNTILPEAQVDYAQTDEAASLFSSSVDDTPMLPELNESSFDEDDHHLGNWQQLQLYPQNFD